MADARFFENEGPISIADLAEVAGATLSEGTDPDMLIEDVAPLDVAGSGHVSFLDNRNYGVRVGVNRSRRLCGWVRQRRG